MHSFDVIDHRKAEEVLGDAVDKTLEPLDYILLENLRQIREDEFNGAKFDAYEKYVKSETLFSQFDMAMVQGAFFAGLVAYPKSFGVANASRYCTVFFVHENRGLLKVNGHFESEPVGI